MFMVSVNVSILLTISLEIDVISCLNRSILFFVIICTISYAWFDSVAYFLISQNVQRHIGFSLTNVLKDNSQTQEYDKQVYKHFESYRIFTKEAAYSMNDSRMTYDNQCQQLNEKTSAFAYDISDIVHPVSSIKLQVFKSVSFYVSTYLMLSFITISCLND